MCIIPNVLKRVSENATNRLAPGRYHRCRKKEGNDANSPCTYQWVKRISLPESIAHQIRESRDCYQPFHQCSAPRTMARTLDSRWIANPPPANFPLEYSRSLPNGTSKLILNKHYRFTPIF